MFCPKCGTQCEDGAAFCPNCGTKFAGVNMSEQGSPVPSNIQEAAYIQQPNYQMQTYQAPAAYPMQAGMYPAQGFQELPMKFYGFIKGLSLALAIIMVVLGVFFLVSSIVYVPTIQAEQGDSGVTTLIVGAILYLVFYLAMAVFYLAHLHSWSIGFRDNG